MVGYNGYSMSNNAVNAYDSGEKPLSKWTKADFVEASEHPEIAQLYTVKDLRVLALSKTSWHHTSSKFNKTNFFSIDEERLNELSVELAMELNIYLNV